MNKFLKVEGKEGLFKDPKSNSIVNTDNEAYYAAKRLKQKIRKEADEKRALEDRVDKLEKLCFELLSEIKRGNKNE